MTKGRKKYADPWILKADQDCLAAEILSNADPLSVSEIIGFLCQQAVEKYLKAFLVFKKFEFRKTHDLEELRDQCAKFDKDFEQLNYFNLTDYAVGFRYPSDEFEPGKEEIDYYLSLTRQTKDLIIKKII